MKVAETKTAATAHQLQAKDEEQRQPFFQGETAGGVLDNGQPSFFTPFGSGGIQRDPFFTRSPVQTKLRIAPPGDEYEREADSMADKVVQRLAQNENGSEQPLAVVRPGLQRKPIFESESAPEVQTKPLNGYSLRAPQIQKKCAECGKEEELQKGDEPGEEETLRKKPIFDSADQPPEDPGEDTVQRTAAVRTTESVLQAKCAECAAEDDNALQRQESTKGSITAPEGLGSQLAGSKGSGSALPDQTRAQMEGAFGADFSNVRIHTDTRAEQMNQSVQAHAFTHGSDIYFNSGKYDTERTEGKRLLGHELAHTLQQGAAVKRDVLPAIQRDGDDDPMQQAIDKVYEALEGWTDSDDSYTIWRHFDGASKGTTDQIVAGVASKANDSIAYVFDWMSSDMVSSHWNQLFGHLVAVRAYGVARLIATQVYSYLSGWTSASNSKSILSIYQGAGELLGNSLVQLEGITGDGRNATAEYLFGDMQDLDAYELSQHFFHSSDTYATGYAAYWIAFKVRKLLSGLSGLDDSEAIVKNFEPVPDKLCSVVLSELETLCQEEWKKPAVTVMMEKMWQSDYERLRVLIPTLPVYDFKRSLLEWAWEVLKIGFDFLSSLIEYGVCGLVGVIKGIVDVAVEVIASIVDIGIAIIDLFGLFVYFITDGKYCKENYDRVTAFFKGLGMLWDAPGDAIDSMWEEVKREGALIEGPFGACERAVFWVSKLTNLVVNALLILAAGYGAVKSALKGIEAIVNLSRAGKLVAALKALPGKVWSAAKGLPAAMAKVPVSAVSKAIGLLRNPLEIIGAARSSLTVIRLAAEDEGYFKFLRQQAGKVVELESKYWSEKRDFWKKGATEIEGGLTDTEEKLVAAVDSIPADPKKAEATIAAAESEANASKSKADDLLDEVNGKKAAEVEGKVIPQVPDELTAGEVVTIPYGKGGRKVRAKVVEVKDGYVKFAFTTDLGGKSPPLSHTTLVDTFKEWQKEGKAIRWLAERQRLMKKRPDYDAGLVEKVWEKAKGTDGKVRDPNPPYQELNWDKSKSRSDQWHMGHKPGEEYAKLVDRYVNGEITYDEFLREYNNPSKYQPELPEKNVSHQFENK